MHPDRHVQPHTWQRARGQESRLRPTSAPPGPQATTQSHI